MSTFAEAVALMRKGYAVVRGGRAPIALAHAPDAEVMNADTGSPAVLYGDDFVADDWERYLRDPETERWADAQWKWARKAAAR